MKKISLTIILLAAMTAGARTSFADDDAMLRRWRIAESDKADSRITRMARPLQLSDTQKADLKAAYEDRINKLNAQRVIYLKASSDIDNATESKILSLLNPDQQKQYMSLREQIEKEERAQEQDTRPAAAPDVGSGRRGGMRGDGDVLHDDGSGFGGQHGMGGGY